MSVATLLCFAVISSAVDKSVAQRPETTETKGPLEEFKTPASDDTAAKAKPIAPFAEDTHDQAAPSGPPAKRLVKPTNEKKRDVAALTRDLRSAIVTVTQQGRSGGVHGAGTGFIVDAKQGLIATNLHVIGEGRPIRVELDDGTEHDVVAVYAWDRKLDLAVIQIDTKGLKLQAISLADSDKLEQGQPIVAFGNPHGLKFSVVQGVASAMRDHMDDASGGRVDFGFPMIQLAIPIEMGNSGGPVVDMQGKVHGIVTIKWLMTENLGFAVPINTLKPLLDTPNQTPMNRWMTIGALDPNRWLPSMGANWSQRSGVIKANGSGAGFGGRSVCISERTIPDAPYELAVEVKLGDENGAAGLAFACSGENSDIHYGFYPSGGQLRLTRFEGPDVYSWTILKQIPTDAYRPGEWNRLRVRVDNDVITGYVNGEKIVELSDGVLRGGNAGLCKFRQTEAEFRHFKIGNDLSPAALPAALLAQLKAEVDKLADGSPPSETSLGKLSKEAETSRVLITAKADKLQQRVDELRTMTDQLHQRVVAEKMRQVLSGDEADIDLLEAGLIIAWLDNPELDVAAYLEDFEQLAKDASESLAAAAPDPLEQVKKLSAFLFEENGFHGSRSQYYHHSNSYLNEVLDDREGLPITLAVVFLELGKRAGLKGLSGLGLPGHFMVIYRPETAEADPTIIDVFDGGRIIDKNEAEAIVRDITGTGLRPEHLESTSKKDIVLRILRNLIGLEMDAGHPDVARPYIDLILAVSPEEAGERFSRALLRYQNGELEGAKSDLKWLLENQPQGIRIDRLQELYDRLP